MRLVKIPGMFGTWNKHKQGQELRILAIILIKKTMLKALVTGVIQVHTVFTVSYHNIGVV